MKLTNILLIFALLCCTYLASSQNIVGGYTKLTPAQIKSTEVQENLKFGASKAIQNLISSKTIPAGKNYTYVVNSAADQVVAGINYKFTITVQNKSKKVSKAVTFVVYQDLTGHREVTSIQPVA